MGIPCMGTPKPPQFSMGSFPPCPALLGPLPPQASPFPLPGTPASSPFPSPLSGSRILPQDSKVPSQPTPPPRTPRAPSQPAPAPPLTPGSPQLPPLPARVPSQPTSPPPINSWVPSQPAPPNPGPLTTHPPQATPESPHDPPSAPGPLTTHPPGPQHRLLGPLTTCAPPNPGPLTSHSPPSTASRVPPEQPLPRSARFVPCSSRICRHSRSLSSIPAALPPGPAPPRHRRAPGRWPVT